MKRSNKRPDEHFPNSWGRAYYNNVRTSASYDEQIDINNHKKRLSFIRKFVTKNIDGASLHNRYPNGND